MKLNRCDLDKSSRLSFTVEELSNLVNLLSKLVRYFSLHPLLALNTRLIELEKGYRESTDCVDIGELKSSILQSVTLQKIKQVLIPVLFIIAICLGAAESSEWYVFVLTKAVSIFLFAMVIILNGWKF